MTDEVAVPVEATFPAEPPAIPGGQSIGRKSKAAKLRAAKGDPAPKKGKAKAAVAKAVKAKKEPKPKKLRGEGVADRRTSEADLIKKYPAIVPGTLRFEDNPKSSHYNKQVVVIRTKASPNGKYDGNEREVATSDVFQIWGTPEAMKAYRAQREAERRAAAKEKKAAKKAK